MQYTHLDNNSFIPRSLDPLSDAQLQQTVLGVPASASSRLRSCVLAAI